MMKMGEEAVCSNMGCGCWRDCSQPSSGFYIPCVARICGIVQHGNAPTWSYFSFILNFELTCGGPPFLSSCTFSKNIFLLMDSHQNYRGKFIRE